MSPNQFGIDWDILTQVLVVIVVLSFFVERALSIVVENRLFVNTSLDDMRSLKEFLSLVVSFIVVKIAGFDALAIIFQLEKPGIPGLFITAAIIAGGSKASIKFFHDVLDIKSTALRQKHDATEAAGTRKAVGTKTHEKKDS